jgi:RHS repeat-associated protein
MSFTYDDVGIRTSKTVDNVKHTYHLNGSQIIAEEWEDKLIVYLYDASGSPMGMMYRTTSYELNNWTTFFFEKNLQGDVVAVYSSSGLKLVTYEYDAWGNQTVTYHSGSGTGPAQYNPFRYRGYYYDTDLEMYYLQSRYYDAKVCRFINADVYISTGYGLIGNNMFAYCNNNPVCYSDPKGKDLMYTCDYDEGYSLNGWLLEGGGVGGTGGGGSYFGLGTAYNNYAVYSNTAAHNTYLGGYYYSGGGSIGGYTAQFATGKVTVTDSMAVYKPLSNNVSYNLNGAKNSNYVSKRGWDEIKINTAISNEVQGTSINRANGKPCVVYRYPGTKNQYVVVESGTRSIVQLSNFYDEGWIPDSCIIWYP